MAGVSPSRRKRNDFTEFFRTSTSSAPSQKELAPTDALAMPSEPEQYATGGYLSPPEGSNTIKKVATKLPFLGRSRKKSTHSVKSGVLSDANSVGYESTDFGESSTASLKKSRRFSQPASSPEHSTPSQAATSSHLFFPSKFAAHFSKSKKPVKISKDDTSRATLNVPTEARPVSFESDTSEASANRSNTPRPTITLSPSPDARPDDIDNLDEFEDLFTRSKYSKKPTPSSRETSSTPASEYRDMFHKGESSVTLTPSRRNKNHSQLTISPEETISDIARREARELAERSSKSKSPSTFSLKPPPSPQTESNEDSADESIRSGSIPDGASLSSMVNRTRSLSPATSSARSSRLRTKSVTTKLPSKPPSIPLPLPPSPKTKPPSPPVTTPPASDKPLPLAPSRTPSRNNSSSSSPGRKRAHTDGSLPPSLVKREAALKAASKPSTPESDKKAPSTRRSSADKENLDVELLTPEQLKEALLKRIARVEELEDQLAEATKTHAAEKTALEKRVRLLEVEMQKRTNENRALVRVLQARVDRSKSSETDTASISSSKYSRIFTSSSPSSSRSNADDSGVESYATSGGESSLHGSSSVRKKAQRPLILSDTLYRSSLPSSKVATKRESMYSLASTSATSSASSLLPPSPSLGGSPLSAILESPSATNTSKTGTVTKRRTAPVIAGESLSDDDKYLSRISRFSSSSSASSSSLSTTAATSAYSANLRRGRPPSIAQVMEKGGIEGHFDKIQITGVTQAVATPYSS